MNIKQRFLFISISVLLVGCQHRIYTVKIIDSKTKGPITGALVFSERVRIFREPDAELSSSDSYGKVLIGPSPLGDAKPGTWFTVAHPDYYPTSCPARQTVALIKIGPDRNFFRIHKAYESLHQQIGVQVYAGGKGASGPLSPAGLWMMHDTDNENVARWHAIRQALVKRRINEDK